MPKNAGLVTLLITMLLCAAVVMGASSVEVKFVNTQIVPHTESLIELSFKTIDVATLSGFSLAPSVGPTPKTGDTPYRFDSYSPNSSESWSSPALPLGYNTDVCWDTTSGQVVAQRTTSGSTAILFSFTPHLIEHYSAETSPLKSWTIRCSIRIAVTDVPTAQFLAVRLDATTTLFPPLTFPAGGFQDALIEFKKVSISQEDSDPLSSSMITFEFTTNQIGVYNMTLDNGGSADPLNFNNGSIADFYCSAGGEKKFARMVYYDSRLSVYVPSVTTQTIKCSALFSNYKADSYVASQRQTAQITFGNSRVSRGIQLKQIKAGVSGEFLHTDPQTIAVGIYTSPLALTAAEIHTNSTIEFIFSEEFNLNNLQLAENPNQTSYRANSNCRNEYGNIMYATSFVDVAARQIVLKDILWNNGNTIQCTFVFTGTDAFSFETNPSLVWFQMKINDSQLAAMNADGDKVSLFQSTLPALDLVTSVETESTTAVTVVDTFSLEAAPWSTSFFSMRNPRLIVSISATNTLNVQNYKDNVTCEMTSPSSNAFSKINLNFDDKHFFWSADLNDLKNVEMFNIQLKCTHSVTKIMQWGLDITPRVSLKIEILDLIDGTYYYGSVSQSGADMKERVQTETQTGQYPNIVGTAYAHYSIELVVPTDYDNAALSKQLITDVTTLFNTDLEWDNGANWTPKVVPGSVSVAFESLSYDIGGNYRNAWSVDEFYSYLTAFNKDGTSNNFSLASTSAVTYGEPTLQTGTIINDANGVVAVVSLYVNFTYKTDGNDTGLPAPTLKLTDPLWKNVYGQAIVPLSKNIQQVNSWDGDPVISAGGCGYVAGFNLWPGTVPYNLNISTDSTQWPSAAAKWAYFTSDLDYSFFTPCQIGSACTMNADCAENLMCSKSVCTEMPKYLPPYIDILAAMDENDGFTYPAADKRYGNFNNSTAMVSALVAVALATLALLF